MGALRNVRELNEDVPGPQPASPELSGRASESGRQREQKTGAVGPWALHIHAS